MQKGAGVKQSDQDTPAVELFLPPSPNNGNGNDNGKWGRGCWKKIDFLFPVVSYFRFCNEYSTYLEFSFCSGINSNP